MDASSFFAHESPHLRWPHPPCAPRSSSRRPIPTSPPFLVSKAPATLCKGELRTPCRRATLRRGTHRLRCNPSGLGCHQSRSFGRRALKSSRSSFSPSTLLSATLGRSGSAFRSLEQQRYQHRSTPHLSRSPPLCVLFWSSTSLLSRMCDRLVAQTSHGQFQRLICALLSLCYSSSLRGQARGPCHAYHLPSIWASRVNSSSPEEE